MVASFWKFYGKEYDDYKWSMPVSRFLGYIDYMNKNIAEQNKNPAQRKIDSLKKTMTIEEKQKYKEEYGE